MGFVLRALKGRYRTLFLTALGQMGCGDPAHTHSVMMIDGYLCVLGGRSWDSEIQGAPLTNAADGHRRRGADGKRQFAHDTVVYGVTQQAGANRDGARVYIPETNESVHLHGALGSRGSRIHRSINQSKFFVARRG
jgi:hypothetical protein